MKTNIIYILLVIFACWACEKDEITEIPDLKSDMNQDTINESNIEPPQFNYDSITDIDGNVYKTIQIGDQVWMAENLKTMHYNDGAPVYLGIGDMAGETDWFDFRFGAFCWYFNDTVNKNLGAIYNWFAVETGKLAPIGWHVPTNEDWLTLVNYLGDEKSAHDDLLSSGNDGCGFNAVSSPILCGWGFGPETSFWSATSYEHPYAFVPYAYYFSIWEENSVEKVSLFDSPQSYGFCVRCLKDSN